MTYRCWTCWTDLPVGSQAIIAQSGLRCPDCARAFPGLPIEEMVVRAARVASEAATGPQAAPGGLCRAGRYGVEVFGDGSWPDCYARAVTVRGAYPLCGEHAHAADAARDLARRIEDAKGGAG